jgi:hypothetical protein
MMNDRMRAFANGPAGKSTKNINLNKRGDLLENVFRDGEVASADHFVMVAYSLLRLAVRYVSQYKPQVLKAVLQEQPKAVSRAVDTLFLFVSSTNNIDEITAEK